MNNTPMRKEQHPNEYLYIMNSCRHRLDACDRPEGSTDRKYEDVMLQYLPPEHKAILQVHLGRIDQGRGDFGGHLRR